MRKKNEITPKSYGIDPVAKFHPHLSPRGEIPSLIEHVLSFHVLMCNMLPVQSQKNSKSKYEICSEF